MKKHTHKIIINNSERIEKSFCYNFGKTKDVCISVGYGTVVISAELSKIYDKAEIISFDGYLFGDALKKALLLHLILFSKDISLDEVYVQIDDETECVFMKSAKAHPLVSSLVAEDLSHPFTNIWDVSACQGILAQTKSSYDARIASLFALIYSKTKIYESERFIYLWMAFNGMYNYYSTLISQSHNGIKIKRECNQIRYMQRLFNLGDETISEDTEKRRVAQEVTSFLKNAPTQISKTYLESERGKEIAQRIQKALVNPKTLRAYNITPYGYLLTQYSYNTRCNLFHANKPISLFSFSNDPDIQCLKIINYILEDFIETNLPLWFSSQYETEFLWSFAKQTEIIR